MNIHPPKVPDRRPESHRFLVNKAVLKNRDKGNRAFAEANYERAERCFTKAIQAAEQDPGTRDDESRAETVALWILYSNRSMCLLKLGKPDLAFQDAVASHVSAPWGPTKPVIRCAQAMAIMGYYDEAKNTLECMETLAGSEGMESSFSIQDVLANILPRKTLLVGPAGCPFSTIAEALLAASDGSEILVEDGVYTQPLLIDKSVTIRSIGKQLQNPEINVSFPLGVAIQISGTSNVSVRVIGFRIVKTGDVGITFHGLTVNGCTAIFRDCTITCSSGPVVCVEEHGYLILKDCTVHDGSQGGILVADDSTLSLARSQVCNNAASGIELRRGGSANIDDCKVFGNGSQGVIAWLRPGRLRVENSEIFNHKNESGVIVGENSSNPSTFRNCKIYANFRSGVNSEREGSVEVLNCEIYDDEDGVQIQGTGNGIVKDCRIFNNADNGIFVGYDHLGNATLEDNDLFGNGMKGLNIGPGLNSRIHASRNKEANNRNRLTCSRMGNTWNSPSLKWAKRVSKNAESYNPGNAVDKYDELMFKISAAEAASLQRCAFCQCPKSEDVCLSRCSLCKEVFYCGKDCQLKDWKRGHKAACQKKKKKHKSFVDHYESV